MHSDSAALYFKLFSSTKAEKKISKKQNEHWQFNILTLTNAETVRLNEAPPCCVCVCVCEIRQYMLIQVFPVDIMSLINCVFLRKCAYLPEFYSRFNVLFIFLSHCKDSISVPFQTNTFRSFTQRRNLYLEEQRKVGVHVFRNHIGCRTVFPV